METRPYFIVGDILACVAAGAVAGWVAYLSVPGDWHAVSGMILGMAIGMILGMFAGMLTGLLFSPFFGAMELMLPTALTGMIAGMVLGMWQAMGALNLEDALWYGGCIGLLCLVFTYFLQYRFQGDVQ